LNDWEIVAWLVDAGETGKDMDRPAFMEALQMVADHEADGVVVAKLDRVARSVADFIALLGWFVSGEKVLAVLDLQVDTSTPTGKLIATVLAAIAEFEADLIADRTAQALQAKRASGLPISRPSVADDEELVERIRELRENGASYQGIADELNALNIPTLRGGSQWRISAIQSVLGYKRPPRQHQAPDLPEIRRKKRAA
jgi:DNA invertase Pin-like site-specific DNA recombinase